MTWSKRIGRAEKEVRSEIDFMGIDLIRRSPGYAAERIVWGLIQAGHIRDGVEGEEDN